MHRKLDRERSVQIALFALLLITLIGPWAYNRIHVPAQYACTLPYVRIGGDFCGTPIPGLLVVLFSPLNILLQIGWLISGNVTAGTIQPLLNAFLFATPLPVIIITAISAFTDKTPRRGWRMGVWSLAAAGSIGFIIAYLLVTDALFVRHWGIWGYIFLAYLALFWEGLSWLRWHRGRV